MDRYQSFLHKSELEINRSSSNISLWELLVMGFIFILDVMKVFTVYSFATQIYWKLALALLLIIPWLLVRVFKLEGKSVKYWVMTCSVLASGLSYIIFNIQAQLLFVFPTILVTMYYNRRLSYYTCGLTLAVLFCSHLTASYLILPSYYRNPYGYQYVIYDTAIPQMLYYLCFAVLVQVLNKKMISMNLRVLQANDENEILLLEKETAELRGRIQERERISRDIHNSVGHTITAAIFALEAARLQRSIDPEAAEEKTDRAIARMRESMDTIRNSVRMMDNSNTMTLGEMEKLLLLCCRQTEQDSFLRIETDFSGLKNEQEQPVSANRIEFLYGMVQECVTNARKHGNANHIWLKAGVEGELLFLEIRNNGNVPDSVPTEGFGLRKLRQYAENVGGRFMVQLTDGFSVCIWLPPENR